MPKESPPQSAAGVQTLESAFIYDEAKNRPAKGWPGRLWPLLAQVWGRLRQWLNEQSTGRAGAGLRAVAKVRAIAEGIAEPHAFMEGQRALIIKDVWGRLEGALRRGEAQTALRRTYSSKGLTGTLRLELEVSGLPQTPPTATMPTEDNVTEALSERAADLADLTEALRHPDPHVRSRAAYHLGEIGPAAVPALIEALKDSYYRARMQAASSLMEIGPAAVGAVPALVEVLSDPRSEDRDRDDAAGVLEHIGPAAAQAVPALVQALRRSEDVRIAASRALGKIGPAAVPELIEALRTFDAEGQYWAANALEAIGTASAAAVPVLIDMLRDPHRKNCGVAASALAAIGPAAAGAVPALIGLVNDSQSRDIDRAGAADALGRIGPASVAAMPDLVKMEEGDRNIKCRLAAAKALQCLRKLLASRDSTLEQTPIIDDIEATPTPNKRKRKRGLVPLRDENPKPRQEPPPLDHGEAGRLATAYQRAAAEVDAESHAFRERVAARLRPHFNAYVKSLPHSTYGQKQDLAIWVNAELKKRGLALKCPKNDMPSFLQADVGKNSEVGRFQFYYYEEGEKVRVTYAELPELELMPDDSSPPLQEERAEGWAAAEKQRKGPGRPRGKS